MSAALAATTPKQTNELGYPEITASNLHPMGDRILLQWEESQDEFRVGKLTLLKSEKHKKLHYTGVVIAVGPLVDPLIKPGMRIAFDQFSNFEKFFDPELGRIALIDESKQASCFAIIPHRVKISNGEGEGYDYDK